MEEARIRQEGECQLQINQDIFTETKHYTQWTYLTLSGKEQPQRFPQLNPKSGFEPHTLSH